MNIRLLTGAACAALAFSSVAAQAATCGEHCPPPCDECTPTPPPTPSLPNAPTGSGVPSATTFDSSGGNPNYGQTYTHQPDQVPYFAQIGGGVGRALDDSLFFHGDSSSSVSFQFDHTNASVMVAAHNGDNYGREESSATLGYTIMLHASSDSVADQIAAILAHAPLAAASGSYTLTATGTAGTAKSSANAVSVYGPNGGSGYTFYTQCDQGAHIGGCTTGSWGINIGFQRGTAFSDGDANTFYGSFYFGGDAAAGSPGLGQVPGDSSAFVDPNILFNQQLSQFGNQISYNIGNGGLGNGGFTALAGNVPEPASWALMLGGFGLLGGAVRRRRVMFQTA
jgi:hypothetical protein